MHTLAPSNHAYPTALTGEAENSGIQRAQYSNILPCKAICYGLNQGDVEHHLQFPFSLHAP